MAIAIRFEVRRPGLGDARKRELLLKPESPPLDRLKNLIAGFDELLGLGRKELKRDCELLLLELGAEFDSIRVKVEGMPFAEVRAQTHEEAKRIWDSQPHELKALVQVALRKLTAQVSSPPTPTAALTKGKPCGRVSPVITTSRRTRRRKHHKALLPPERRAHTVAQIIEELNRLRPRMTGAESDYSELARENPHFATFKVARKHPELKDKVLNLQDHRRHIRLAQELAAAFHGRALSTVQTDWKDHKPKKYQAIPK